jgi:hypothetical protein
MKDCIDLKRREYSTVQQLYCYLNFSFRTKDGQPLRKHDLTTDDD